MVAHPKTLSGCGSVVHDILVVDDFLPHDTYDDLARLISSEPLLYGARSNSTSDPHGHWSKSFTEESKYNLADVAHVLEGGGPLNALGLAWKITKSRCTEGGILVRCYVNGYTFGTEGYFHTDSDRPDDRTVIIFMVDRWEADWAGETAYLDEYGEIVRSVLPKRNRAIVFRSNIQHAARGVSRKCVALRKTLIFKMRNRRSRNFERLSSYLTKRGATSYQHKKGTLHDHLARTFSILEKRGFADEICLAGGLHSVYGTACFPQILMDTSSSSEIVDEFGEQAAHLAYLFSILDRPKTLVTPVTLGASTVTVIQRDGNELILSREAFDALVNIECANLEDQDSLRNYPSLQKIWNEGQICMSESRARSPVSGQTTPSASPQ